MEDHNSQDSEGQERTVGNLANFFEKHLKERPAQSEEGRDEEGHHGHPRPDDGPGRSHQVYVPQAHRLFAESQRAKNTRGPDDTASDEIAEQTSEEAGHRRDLKKMAP